MGGFFLNNTFDCVVLGDGAEGNHLPPGEMSDQVHHIPGGRGPRGVFGDSEGVFMVGVKEGWKTPMFIFILIRKDEDQVSTRSKHPPLV